MSIRPQTAYGPARTPGVPVTQGTVPSRIPFNEVRAGADFEAPLPHVRALQKQLSDRLDARPYLQRQAALVREMGSNFVSNILEAGQRNLHHGRRTSALIANWPGDLACAAMSMRFNAALHALARQGKPASLAALYAGRHDDFDGAIAKALTMHDDYIANAMQNPTQTNEVGRAAAFMSALMVLSSRTGMPFTLLELGASAGLNLNLAHYAYDLGGVPAGDPASSVRIAPEWRGAPPPQAPVEIRSTRGVDLNPLDPCNPATPERLMSFIWADQPDRLKRLEQALEIARCHPPAVDQANGSAWIIEQLHMPQSRGLCRVVFHSMVLQYLDCEDRHMLGEAIQAAGARATAESPLAWISFEWTGTRSEVRLLLTRWPDGETCHLATCHPYGDWIDWKEYSQQSARSLPCSASPQPPPG